MSVNCGAHTYSKSGEQQPSKQLPVKDNFSIRWIKIYRSFFELSVLSDWQMREDEWTQAIVADTKHWEEYILSFLTTHIGIDFEMECTQRAMICIYSLELVIFPSKANNGLNWILRKVFFNRIEFALDG